MSIIKVGNVLTLNQLKTLIESEVDLICLDYKFAKNFYSSIKNLMVNFLMKKSSIVLDLNNSFLSEKEEYIDLDFFDYIQIPYQEKNDFLFLNKKKIIYSDIRISYDDDLNWIFDDSIETKSVYYEIDLLGEIPDSWRFLEVESPKYPEEVQISDLVKLGIERNIFLSLNFNKRNISKIVSLLDTVSGFSMKISYDDMPNDIHVFSFEEIITNVSFFKRI